MSGPLADPSGGLPDTASPKEAVRRWPVLAPAGLGVLVLALLAADLSRSWGFSPGEELSGGGLEGIVVSAEDGPYLPPDVERFGRGYQAIYVYVVVRRMPSGGRLEARVERESAASVLSRLIPGEEGVVLERLGVRTGPGEDLDVVRFALRERSGETVPPGNYTVGVYREPGGAGTAEPMGRKFFVVRGRLP